MQNSERTPGTHNGIGSKVPGSIAQRLIHGRMMKWMSDIRGANMNCISRVSFSCREGRCSLPEIDSSHSKNSIGTRANNVDCRGHTLRLTTPLTFELSSLLIRCVCYEHTQKSTQYLDLNTSNQPPKKLQGQQKTNSSCGVPFANQHRRTTGQSNRSSLSSSFFYCGVRKKETVAWFRVDERRAHA